MLREFDQAYFDLPSQPSKIETAVEKSSPFKQLLLTDLEGKKAPVISGKRNLIVFWATWCEPCIDEIPLFNKLLEQYPNLNIASINLDPSDSLPQFVKDNDIRYQVLVDKSGTIEEKFAVSSIPLTIMLDENGKELWKVLGNDKPALEKNMKSTMSQASNE